jgi:alpha,alpha-trehalose phosphorylase
MDLRDLESNTRDGVHIASLAGIWLALVGGFGGMRHQDGVVSFAPRLPEELTRLAFGLLIRGRRLRIEVTQREATYLLADGKACQVGHYDETVRLTPGKPQTRKLRPVPALPRPSQPPGREPPHRRPSQQAT